MIEPKDETVHGSAVVAAGHGILIRGASGSGKSSLALALIDDQRLSARLIADDRVRLVSNGGALIAGAPQNIAGLVEVRGIGIVTIEHAPEAPLALIVDLLPEQECPRYPAASERTTSLHGVDLPRLALPIGVSDGPLRVRLALKEWIA